MSKYLISTCETYRVESENEVKNTIEEAKKDKKFVLTKYVSEYKERKQKGEVIDNYYKLTLTKVFNDLKEPDCNVEVSYKVEDGYFPDPVEKDEGEAIEF